MQILFGHVLASMDVHGTTKNIVLYAVSNDESIAFSIPPSLRKMITATIVPQIAAFGVPTRNR